MLDVDLLLGEVLLLFVGVAKENGRLKNMQKINNIIFIIVDFICIL